MVRGAVVDNDQFLDLRTEFSQVGEVLRTGSEGHDHCADCVGGHSLPLAEFRLFALVRSVIDDCLKTNTTYAELEFDDFTHTAVECIVNAAGRVSKLGTALLFETDNLNCVLYDIPQLAVAPGWMLLPEAPYYHQPVAGDVVAAPGAVVLGHDFQTQNFMAPERPYGHHEHGVATLRERVTQGSYPKTILMVHAVDNQLLLKPTTLVEECRGHQAAGGDGDQRTSVFGAFLATGTAGDSFHLD